MTPERWQQVRNLLQSAMQLEPAERLAYLEHHCSDDPSLRRDVDSILAGEHELPASFLESPAIAHVTPDQNTVVSANWKPGMKLGPYEIQSLLGAGGMGEVYRARDTRLDRTVALKVLPALLSSDPARKQRFEREARAIAALQHPNICTLHDVGQQQGVDYLVMEYLEGETLAERLTKGLLQLEQILRFGVEITDALDAAHRRGIVHRDLKPGNIFLTTHGECKVLDFGLAKLEESQAEPEKLATVTANQKILTTPGLVIGTVAYMSPEQARGEELDARSDIFSLGAVLFEMATGQLAFTGNTSAMTFKAILDETPVPPTQLNKALPQKLDEIVGKALEKDRDLRYQSAADLRTDLKRLKRDTDSGKAQAFEEGAERPASWKRTFAVLAAVAVVLLFTAMVFYRSQTNKRPSAGSEWVQLTNFVDSATSPALSPDGRMLVFLRGASTFAGKSEIYLRMLSGGEPIALTHDATSKMSPVFSPDGSQIAYTISARWDTWILPTFGGEPQLLLPNASGLTWTGPRQFLFSELREGRHMVLAASEENRNGERVVFGPPGKGSMAHRSYRSPDGKWVLVVWMSTGRGWEPCRLVPFDGSSAGKAVGPPNSGCTYAGWSPDGKWMYFSSETAGRFHTWKQGFPDGTPEQITSGVDEEEGIAVALDGRSLITSVGTKELTVWTHDSRGDHQITSEGRAYLPDADGASGRQVFSPDGSRVYYMVDRRPQGSASELWTTEIDTGKSEQVVSEAGLFGFDISPDGRNVVYSIGSKGGDRSIWVARMDHLVSPRQLTSKNKELCPVFTPQGDLVFMSQEGDQSFLYRMQLDGSERRKFYAGPVIQLETISPDGRWVIAQAPIENEDVPRGILAIPLEGGAPVRICSGLCVVRWSLDGKSMFFSVIGGSQGQVLGWGTYTVPLAPGQMFPKLPPTGLASKAEAAALPGAKPLDAFVLPGQHETIYAFSRSTVHRNLFRIPLP